MIRAVDGRLVGRHEGAEGRVILVEDIGSEQEGEGLVAHDVARAPDSVAEAARLLLAHEDGVGSALGRQRLAGLLVDVADDHARTFAQQQQDDLTADTAGAAGDQGDLVFDLFHMPVLISELFVDGVH